MIERFFMGWGFGFTLVLIGIFCTIWAIKIALEGGAYS